MSGDPTLGTWQPDVAFSDGIGGTFNQTPAYNPAMYGDGGRGAPQSLLNYPDSSYAQARGWDPSPYAMNNSGPALGGGDWGGLMSDGGLYPDAGGGRGGNFSVGYDTPPNPYGDLSGVSFDRGGSPYGDLSGVPQFQDPTGGASNGSLYPGGDYNDNFNPQYINPYGDLPGMSTPGLLDGFQGSYERGSVPMPPPRPDYLPQPAPDVAAGAQLGGGDTYAPSYYTPGFAERGAAMPQMATPNTWGAPGSEVAPVGFGDQTYMDEPQGPYGSLMGGPDYDSSVTYERASASPPPAPAQTQEAYLFPTQPLVMPTGPNSDASPPPMPAAQYFSERGGTPPSNYDPAFGQLSMNFQPMPGDPNSGKITDRANQQGGFVSYGGQGNIYDSQQGLLPGLLGERVGR